MTPQLIFSNHAERNLLNLTLKFELWGGGNRVLGSLKISLCEERRLEDTQNLKYEDRRFQNCLVLTTDDLATKPTKLED